MTDQLPQAITLYTDLRRTGLNKTAAKRRVYAELPGFKDTICFGTSLAPTWARSLQKAEADLRAPNGANGHTPDSATPPAAPTAYSPTDDMLAYLTALDPAPGDQLTLNLHYLAWKHHKANDAAWRYVFADNGSLARLGWRFELINKSGLCYQLRVLERPQTQQQREIDQLKAQLHTIQEQLARLQTRPPSAQQGLF